LVSPPEHFHLHNFVAYNVVIMVVPIPLLADENVVAQVTYHPHSKAEPFAITITTQAFLILSKKLFAVRNPYFYERVPLSELRAIRVKRLRAVWWYVLAGLLVVVGAYTTWGMFNEDYRNIGGQLSKWPIIVLVAGLLLPFAARGRYGLIVAERNKSFTWKPAFVIGTGARQKQDDIISTIVTAARSLGVIVQDERRAA
jgi:hypothetical protein